MPEVLEVQDVPSDEVRILPDDVNAEVNLGSWKQPEVFDWIEEEGNVDKDEMLKTFNCGIGYILIVDKETTTDVIKVINEGLHKAGDFITLGILRKNKMVNIELELAGINKNGVIH